MNIIQLQDRLKDFSEQQLVQEMQSPSGNAPQYLVLTELERRKKAKDRFKAQQQPESTVAEETVMQAARMPTGIMGMKQGGAVKYQNRGYVPSSNLLRAIAMQESRMDPRAVGDAGEIGMYQIMPTTAIDPGYNIPSLFPELQSQIGQDKKFASAQEAYEANKDIVDEVLFNPSQSERFAQSYIDTAKSRFPDDEARAIAAYNLGIRGAEKIEDPLSFPYVQGVGSFVKSPDETATAPSIPFISAAQASTGEQEQDSSKGIYGNVSFSNMIDSLGDFLNTGDSQSGIGALADQNRQKLIQSGLFNRAVDPNQVGEAEGQALIARRQQRIGEMEQQVAAMPNKTVIGTVINEYLNDPDIAVRQRAQAMLDEVNQVTTTATQAGKSPARVLADPETVYSDTIPTASSVTTPTPAEEEARIAKQFQEEATAQAASAEAQQKRAERGPQATKKDAQPAGGAELAGAGDVSIAGAETEAQSALDKILQLQKSQTEQAREDEQFNRYLALAQMGAALAASKSPTLLGAAGEAIQTGLPTLAESRKGLREAEKEELSTQLAVEKIRQEAKTKNLFGLEDRLRVANAINDDIINLQKQIDQLAPLGTAATPDIQARIDEKLAQIAGLQQDRQLLIGNYGFGATAPATTQGSGGISVADLQAERAAR
jgi:hypothetical protein